MTQLEPIADRLASALTVLACYLTDECPQSDQISEADLAEALEHGQEALADWDRWSLEHALNQQALPLEPESLCAWQEDDDGVFETQCGGYFSFTEGTIEDNRFRFCPYCGAPIDRLPTPRS